MVRVLLVGAALAVLLLSAVWLLQRRLIYYPSTSPVPDAASVFPSGRDVVLETSDGILLGGWYVPASGPDRGLTVLVANGNGGDRAGRAPLARALSERGMSVLLFDYRGYAGNAGSPSEEGLARDVRAARSWLVEEQQVPPDRLLYLGESLGTGVVSELAAEHPPAALVLRSPYVDLPALARVHYPYLPTGLLLRDRFPLVDHLRRVDVPVLVVYGTADSVVPPEQSRQVADAAPRLWREVAVPGADHNDPALFDGADLVEAVLALADHVQRDPPS